GGKRQYVEEIRRLEFWSLTGAPGAINPRYSVRLATSVLPAVTVKAHGYPISKFACGQGGFFDLKTWGTLVRTQILHQLQDQGVNPRTFPMFLVSGVLLFDGDLNHCCSLGYHSAFNVAGGTQTYGVADYDVSQTIPGSADVTVLAGEIAAW